jgi:signal transduction histidine kinase
MLMSRWVPEVFMETMPTDSARRSQDRLSDALLDTVAYLALAIGYLTSILVGGRLTAPGFAVMTLANLGWVWLFRRLSACHEPSPRLVNRYVLGLIAMTLVAAAAPWLGINLDWLLPLVTISVIAVAFSWRKAALLSIGVWLVTALDIFALDRSGSHPNYSVQLENQISLFAAFAFVFAFSLVFNLQMEQRKRAEALVAQLEEAQAQLRTSAREMEELATTRERNRMAREIHDTLGHFLTILAVKLETAIKLEEHGDARLREELVEARRVATESLAEVRRSVAALRPTDPTAASLPEALARLVAEFEGAAPDVETALDVEGPVEALTPELRVALYRCAQEALTNIRKHAQATKVLVRLRVDARRAELTVLDNGRGVEAGADGREHGPGFGLLGMRERIELLGGTARACGEPGHGWRVEVAVPLAEAAPDPDRRGEMRPPAQTSSLVEG